MHLLFRLRPDIDESYTPGLGYLVKTVVHVNEAVAMEKTSLTG